MKNLSTMQYGVCLAINASISGLGTLIMPLAIGALAQSGMSAKLLGVLAFLEMGGAALVAFGISMRIKKLNPIYLILFGALVTMLANVASALFVHSALALAIVRPIAGIGSGFMGIGGTTLVARLKQPERIYGYMGTAPCISALVGFSLAPWLIGLTGSAAGLFLFEAVLTLVNFVLVFVLRLRLTAYSDMHHARESGISHGGASAVEVAGIKLDVTTRMFGFLAAFTIGVCDISLWSFAAPLGVSAGIPLASVSWMFTVAAIIGFFGPLLAGQLGDRLGMALPITIGLLAMLVTSMIVVMTHDAFTFQIALYARVFAVLFLLPIYQGLFARIDPSGGFIAATSGVSQIGYTVGPLVAGMLINIQTGAFFDAGILASVAASVSLIAILVMLSRQRETLARNADVKMRHLSAH